MAAARWRIRAVSTRALQYRVPASWQMLVQGDNWLWNFFRITWFEIYLEGGANVERVPILHSADEVEEVLQPQTLFQAIDYGSTYKCSSEDKEKSSR